MGTRYLGNDQVLTLETADSTHTIITYVTETEVDDGTPDRQVMVGGDFNQVAKGNYTYRIESMAELDETASTGNWAYANTAASRSGTAPTLARFYPSGTADGKRYFEIDATIEVHDEGLAKDGKGMFRILAEPHIDATSEPDWKTVGS